MNIDDLLIPRHPLPHLHEQQVANACKQLVQNVIVCWNCLYLNQYLFRRPEPSVSRSPTPLRLVRP
ncbi:Tn3 family transposase [Hymenobacter lutimineralis]|uniref:Tn3 family transposase n=1 Tax=Hymenobacter lutimineralis TaxID=2606448 RepID=A0A5D6VDL2_9BACT|nr:Tn3 family transposase [Hymenobacter lutimineralis]